MNIPKIGTIMPGTTDIVAGIIRGETQDRVLLLTTIDLGERAWGGYGKLVPGADSRFDGEANTRAMAEAGNELAAEILGHNAYLAAINELALLRANLPEHFEPIWHLSSTQDGAHYAYAQTFGGGGQSYFGKGSTARVRLVRSFVL